MKRIIVGGLLFSCVIGRSFPASAGSLVWGSTEMTQIANWAELTQQTLDQYQELQRIKQQLEELYRQGEQLTDMHWGTAFDDLQQLAHIVRDGQAMAYSLSNIDEEFRSRFKWYGEYLKTISGYSNETFQEKAEEWSKSNEDTIRSALKAANLQYDQFATEEVTMKALELHSETAIGRMQAVQAGNEIAAQQVRQMQKLRSLMMAQMQMQGNFMAIQREREEMQDARAEEFFKDRGRIVAGDEEPVRNWLEK